MISGRVPTIIEIFISSCNCSYYLITSPKKVNRRSKYYPYMKKICVLGLGYIGLPTSLLFSQNNKVVGVDVNDKIVDLL